MAYSLEKAFPTHALSRPVFVAHTPQQAIMEQECERCKIKVRTVMLASGSRFKDYLRVNDKFWVRLYGMLPPCGSRGCETCRFAAKPEFNYPPQPPGTRFYCRWGRKPDTPEWVSAGWPIKDTIFNCKGWEGFMSEDPPCPEDEDVEF